MKELARLKWRCRRGMRELDFLLGRYLQEHYPRASPEEQAAFGKFLELPDPVILSWVTGREQPPQGYMGEIVAKLLHQSGA
jgi:antitoxin CptB